MNSNRFLSTHLRSDKIPQFCGSHLITEDHSAKHAVLPHTHEDFLELYYAVSYTHLRAHETLANLVCRLLLEKIFFNDTATTEIYTLHIVGSVRCV